ncbi:MAG: lactonase family protein [Spirochaetales bacterium]|jgi:6-phosphogluconolactonase|nr:lactonase family protein [Spirochaetales bacterium]
MDFYIGTYTHEFESKGIYRASLQLDTGTLEPAELVAELDNPSFLALDSVKPFLYSVSEKEEAELVSFRIEDNGQLTRIDSVKTGGSSACHLTPSQDGRFLYATNYGDGSVVIAELSNDGSFKAGVKVIQHVGSSINPERQEGPHAHSAIIDPFGSRLLVADLGIDRIVVYQINPVTGNLIEEAEASGSAIPGSGPRHLCFHPDGRLLYCIYELTGFVSVYKYVPGEKLELLHTVPGLPADFTGVNTAADIHVSAGADYLYTSNRGHDSIAAFDIRNRQIPVLLGHIHTGGSCPRNFNIVGKFLLAANKDSHNIVEFEIGSDGIPAPTGNEIAVPMPSCIRPVL